MSNLNDRLQIGRDTEDNTNPWVVILDGQPLAKFTSPEQARAFARGYIEGFLACQEQTIAAVNKLQRSPLGESVDTAATM